MYYEHYTVLSCESIFCSKWASGGTIWYLTGI